MGLEGSLGIFDLLYEGFFFFSDKIDKQIEYSIYCFKTIF